MTANLRCCLSATGQVGELVDGVAKVALFGTAGLLAGLAQPLQVPETWVGEPEVA